MASDLSLAALQQLAIAASELEWQENRVLEDLHEFDITMSSAGFVIVGDESPQDYSVLEAITGLPWASDYTRRLTRILFRHRPRSNLTATMGGETIYKWDELDPETLASAIAKAADFMSADIDFALQTPRD